MIPTCRFRWVFCQFDFLRHCLPGRIRRALAELPETLDATYERTLQDINKAKWEFAHRLFQSVAVASRPLRVEEIAELLAFEFNGGYVPEFHEDFRLEDPVDAVLSTCSSLLAVVIVGDSRVIQFSHFSVKEYLTSSRLAQASDIIFRRHHISATLAHTLVAQACLGILLHLDNNITGASLQKFPFAKYAAEHWIDHAVFEGVSGNIENGVKALFEPTKPHFGIWVWIYDRALPPPMRALGGKTPLSPEGTPLYYAAICGLEPIVEFLVIRRSQDVHCGIPQVKLTPLHGAASSGHAGVARVLLGYGADLRARDRHGSTPLHLASSAGHVEVARVLYEYGADVTAQDYERRNPLHGALFEGHVEVARVLLEWGADARAKDILGFTPLHWVWSDEHVELARLLLERGADARAKDIGGSTLLHWVSFGGHAELARTFIEYGADVTAREHLGWTPLHQASTGGHVELTRVLLEFGADVMAQDNFGSTPLHRASSGGHVELARIFLDHGADLETQDDKGSTALHLASDLGHVELARILLDRGDDPSIQNKKGSTPRHLASEWGHVELANILREAEEVRRQQH